MKLLDALQTALRAARVPGNVAAKVLSHVEEMLEAYKINDDKLLLSLPDWNLWLVIVKSILSPTSKMLKKEGYCHANAMVVSAVMVLDERVASMVKRWVRDRCRADLDPCCRNPVCCNLG